MIFRKLFSFVFSFLLLLPAFSLGGALADSSSPLHVIQTQYFDIIFPEECRESATKIEAVCDDYYLEITKLLETEPYQRFPVTITRSLEVLNAYYAAIPYNRIVLYDTIPEESLDMYEDTIQSVFYHELTHAVTYNMKGKALRKLSFFADALNPAWLSVATFWAEGATVSFESRKAGGRLNDPFSTQIVNQAKIEGNFPSWRDVTGTRDTYPGGNDAYIFGSMFASYLQEKYGMSRYADFWKNACSTLTPRFIASVFEKTYDNKSVSEEWEEFEKTLDVPHKKKDAKLFSHKKSRVTAFDVFNSEEGETKIAYFDTASSSLRLLTIKKDGKIKNKKLLAINGLTRVSFSPDGNKLALSRNIDKKNYKCVIAEYDIKKGRYTEHGLNEIRDAFFVLKDEKEELCGVQFEGSRARANSVPLRKACEIPFSPVPVAENLSAAIIKDGLNWKIRLFGKEILSDFVIDAQTEEKPDSSGESAAAKKTLILHNLHTVSSCSNSIFLSFTWAALGEGGKMLSRAGFLKIDRATMNGSAFLQKENSFAGFLDAVPEKKAAEIFSHENECDESESFALFVTAAEYDKTPLYSVLLNAVDFEKVTVKTSDAEENRELNPQDGLTAGNGVKLQPEFAIKKHPETAYSSLNYYRRGVLLPGLGYVPVYNFEFEQDSTTVPGLTFISTNPWGDKRISFAAGYDYYYQKYGMELGFSGGDDSFQYALSGTAVFDKNGFMQTADTLSVAKSLWSGKISSLTAGAQGQFFYGKQIIDEEFEDNTDESTGKSADALAYVQFSNLHKISPKPYNYFGLALKPFVLGSYRTSETVPDSDKYLNAGLQTTFRFPVFFPVIVTGTLFPSRNDAVKANATAILFDWEIHKGIPAVSLFVQRFVVSAGYTGKIAYSYEELWDVKRSKEIFENVKKSDYSDVISLSAEFHLSPNTGFLANGDIQFSLGYALLYRPNPKPSENRVGYGITVSANY
ncbi:MAG: hypothetical protein II821_10240 [Treponema sp.]|nr:hypothetical protein [Treponema sp.]